MKIVIDSNSGVPLNEQIRMQILRQIIDGELKENECLPSIRFVARELGIGVITVKTAYEKLESDGFIYTVQGKGCFVSGTAAENKEPVSALAKERLSAAVEYCRSLGVDKDELIKMIEELF